MTAADRHPFRLLVVAGREPWPLNSGGRLRLYHFLRGLTGQFELTLLLPRRPEYTQQLPAGLRIIDASARTAAGCHPPPARRPSAAAGDGLTWPARLARRHFGYSPAMFDWLRRHARPAWFDAALIYGAVAGQYVDALRVPAVWDAVDELVLYTMRDVGRRGWPARARAAALYALFERHVARRAAATVFTSPVDASYARRWVGPARVETISNGVDFEYFRPSDQPPEAGTVAFVGSLSFPPNVHGIRWFARWVWPLLQAGGCGRRLVIAGRDPAPAVRDLTALPGVELHADVSDVRQYLARAAVVIAPIWLGGGVKNKVLEACAMRRPVVATPRALAGLSARRGIDVLCAGQPESWQRQVAMLLNSPSRSAALAANGYQWVRNNHDWARITRRLADLLRDKESWPGQYR